MLSSVWAVIRKGKIEPLEQIDVPDGTRAVVTFLVDGDAEFWLNASQVSLDDIWDNSADDVYAKLLEE